ncbi:MAG: hypothetical protein ACYC2H_01465 [Thermoplasmatota archaeon]
MPFFGDKPVYDSRPRVAFNQSTYDAWRASLPWTAEQIAAAHEELAAAYFNDKPDHWLGRRLANQALWIRRTDRFSSAMLRQALPILIKTCDVVEAGVRCGGTALYRTANEGRCKRHRLVPAAAALARARRLDARFSERDDETSSRDKVLRARWALHQSSKRRRQ